MCLVIPSNLKALVTVDSGTPAHTFLAPRVHAISPYVPVHPNKYFHT